MFACLAAAQIPPGWDKIQIEPPDFQSGVLISTNRPQFTNTGRTRKFLIVTRILNPGLVLGTWVFPGNCSLPIGH